MKSSREMGEVGKGEAALLTQKKKKRDRDEE